LKAHGPGAGIDGAQARLGFDGKARRWRASSAIHTPHGGKLSVARSRRFADGQTVVSPHGEDRVAGMSRSGATNNKATGQDGDVVALDRSNMHIRRQCRRRRQNGRSGFAEDARGNSDPVHAWRWA
jgi:hypothetical protein